MQFNFPRRSMKRSNPVRSLGAAASLCMLLVHPAQAQTPDSYLQRLKDAEAGIAALPADAWNASRTPQQNEAILPFSAALQRLGTERAFTGDTAGAIAAFDAVNRTRRKLDPAEAKIVDDASVEDAVQAIVAQARTRRVVLLNEGHNMPMHRAFSQRVARELRKIGYSYLACETFDLDSAQAFAAGYPNQNGGYYTRDPVFGAWIAEAIADHWKLVAYEKETPRGLPIEQALLLREEGQARNLVERIFARDKDAKVLIHVGYGHLYKGSVKLPSGADRMLMGEYLRRMTGLDMLHVDQTRFYAHPEAADESPLYARMLAKPGTQAPFVLRSQQGEYAVLHGMKGRVDMQVVFPRYVFSDSNGRPEWLTSLAGRTPHAIPAALLPATGRRAVLAYRAGEPADAVPADVVLVEAGKPVPKLMLPKGEYRFAAED
jgi:hypothetical protein